MYKKLYVSSFHNKNSSTITNIINYSFYALSFLIQVFLDKIVYQVHLDRVPDFADPWKNVQDTSIRVHLNTLCVVSCSVVINTPDKHNKLISCIFHFMSRCQHQNYSNLIGIMVYKHHIWLKQIFEFCGCLRLIVYTKCGTKFGALHDSSQLFYMEFHSWRLKSLKYAMTPYKTTHKTSLRFSV